MQIDNMVVDFMYEPITYIYIYIYIDGRQPKTRISKFAIVQETKKKQFILQCHVTLCLN